MCSKATKYFRDLVIPRLRDGFPSLLSESIIVVVGSVGLGIGDHLSDLEANLFLPDDLWEQDGWHMQIILNHCVRETCTWKKDGSVISVCRMSEIIDGHGQEFLEREEDYPWEQVTFETLFGVQNNLVVHDPRGLWAQLRRKTDPSRFPGYLWQKRLLAELKKLVWADLPELQVCVQRGKNVESIILAGQVIEDLLHLGFYASKRYFPWRTNLRWAFDQLTSLPSGITNSLGEAMSATAWETKLAAVQATAEQYVSHISAAGLLPGIDLSADDLGDELVWAERLQAWSAPNWRDYIDRCKQDPKALAEHPDDWWVFSLWDT